MKSKYTRKELSTMFASQAEHFKSQIAEHPELKSVVNNMIKAAAKLDAPPVVKEVKAVEVEISIKGDEVLIPGKIPGTNFNHVRYGMARVKGDDTGKKHEAPGRDYDGTPIFRSAWDKKRKCFVVPLENKDALTEMLTNLEGAKVSVKEVTA
jgi:hypothetical protein